MNEETIKAALKEAIKEWLDDKFTTLGKWTAGSLGAVIVAAAVYFVLHVNGWTLHG